MRSSISLPFGVHQYVGMESAHQFYPTSLQVILLEQNTTSGDAADFYTNRIDIFCELLKYIAKLLFHQSPTRCSY